MSNAAQPIIEVRINQDNLQSTEHTGRWIWQSMDGNPLNITTPMRVSVRGKDGRVVGSMIRSWEDQYLGIQI